MEMHIIKEKQRTGHRRTQAWTRTDSRKAGEQNIVQAEAVGEKKKINMELMFNLIKF